MWVGGGWGLIFQGERIRERCGRQLQKSRPVSSEMSEGFNFGGYALGC